MKYTCVFFGLALLFVSCSGSDDDDGSGGYGSDDWGDTDDYPGGGSPTGTFLDPRDGMGGDGYDVIDEVCEGTDSPTYIERFETPMFRDVVVVNQVAYLVDGSLLWAVDITEPANPVRVSLTRLSGHPKSIREGVGNNLLIAAGEAGVLTVDISDPSSPVLANVFPLGALAMDVDTSDDLQTAYVASGDNGLIILDVGDPLDPALLSHVPLGDFSAAVDYQDDFVYVAACKSMSIVDVTSPVSPASPWSYWVPGGHGRELDAVGNDLFVAGGEALFSFDISDPTFVQWTGFYNDLEAEGFYVNAVVVRNGVAYIAAGDESVRAVDVSFIGNSGTRLPPRDSDDPPSLDDPEDLPPAENEIETIEVEEGDPIGIALDGDLLLVLGNFRWMGERLLRIMSVAQPLDMVDVGAYVQPNHTRGIQEYGDNLLLHGENGAEKIVSSGTGAELLSFQVPAQVRKASVDGDTLLLITEDGAVYRYADEQTELVYSSNGYDVACGASHSYLSDHYFNGLVSFETSSPLGVGTTDSFTLQNSFLGFSWVLLHEGRLFSYDWALGNLHTFDVGSQGGLTNMEQYNVGLCEMYDFADFYSGQKNIRSRLAAEGNSLALLCPYDSNNLSSIKIYDSSLSGLPMTQWLILPSGRFFDIDLQGTEVYGVGFDNNTYRSTLVRYDPGGVVDLEFDGQANGVVVQGDEVFVTDGDFGLRRFELVGSQFVEMGQTQYFGQEN